MVSQSHTNHNAKAQTCLINPSPYISIPFQLYKGHYDNDGYMETPEKYTQEHLQTLIML